MSEQVRSKCNTTHKPSNCKPRPGKHPLLDAVTRCPCDSAAFIDDTPDRIGQRILGGLRRTHEPQGRLLLMSAALKPRSTSYARIWCLCVHRSPCCHAGSSYWDFETQPLLLSHRSLRTGGTYGTSSDSVCVTCCAPVVKRWRPGLGRVRSTWSCYAQLVVQRMGAFANCNDSFPPRIWMFLTTSGQTTLGQVNGALLWSEEAHLLA